jgi:hypothetical protein
MRNLTAARWLLETREATDEDRRCSSKNVTAIWLPTACPLGYGANHRIVLTGKIAKFLTWGEISLVNLIFPLWS